MKKLGIMIIAMALVAATGVKAQLAVWENDNLVTATNSTPVDTVAVGMSAGNLKLGPSLVVPGDTWENALDAYIYSAGVSNLVSAIATGHYYGFTVTPSAGKQADYTNIAARVTLSDSGGAGASLQVVLMSSATGFADGDEIGSFIASTPPGVATDNGLISMDISAVSALQDQPSPVEFRLYIIPAGGSYGRVALGHIFFEDGAADVQVDGIVEEATSLPVVALAQWELDDLNPGGTSSATVDSVYAGMSSSDLAAPATALASTRIAPAIGWKYAVGTFAENWRLSSSLEFALQNDIYYGFTLTPDSGKSVSYENLFLRVSVNTGKVPTSDVRFTLLSEQTGFATNAVLGSLNATNAVTGYGPTTYTVDFDLSTFPELQSLSEPTEFRIYFNSTLGDRMAIGQAFTLDGADDLVVSGTIEELAYVPATIVSWSSVSDSVMKLVVDAPADPAFYYPKGATDLTLGFSGVAHSDSAAGPFEITNLTYSAAEGDNEVIYVQTTEAQKFFGIGEE